jgi:ABC-2 type transport system permease protein
MSPSRGSFVRLVVLVARRDYLRTVRRRGFVLGTLLLPLSIGFFFLLSSLLSTGQFGNDSDPGSVTLIVVDESSVELDSAFSRSLELVDRATAEARLADGAASEYYLVPSTWPASPVVTRVSAAGTGTSLDAAQRQSSQVAVLEALLRDGLLAGSGLPQETEVRVLVPVQLQTMTTEGEEVSDLTAVASYLIPFAFTLLFVMSIFITSGYLLQSVTEEKENRVVEIVLSSVPSLPLMAGKILGLGAAGLTQVGVWLLTALIAIPLLSARTGGTLELQLSAAVIVLAVTYFVLGYLAYGAIFAAIGALAPGNREAQQYSGFFGFFAVIPLIFSTLLLTDPQSPIVWVLAIFPLTAPATMLMTISLSESIPWAMVAASLTSLVLFVWIATIASSRIFRATLLLYGVRPGMRQLTDAVLDRR